MKWIATLALCIFAPFFLPAQENALHWELSAKKNDNASYTITARITLAAGWHAYAQDDAGTGIEQLRLDWDNENITKDGSPVISPDPLPAADPVFDNQKLLVYKESVIEISQKIKV